MKFGPRTRPSVEINLTPLIDILFIVLLFLVMTATFASRTFIQIDLPRAATGSLEGIDPNVVRLDVDAAGRVYLGGQVVELEAVRDYLRAVKDPEAMTVVLAADERTPHGLVVRVIDLVRAASVLRLRLETVRARVP